MKRLSPADDDALSALAAHFGYGHAPSPSARRADAQPPARDPAVDEYPASDEPAEFRLPPPDAPEPAAESPPRQGHDPGPLIPVPKSPWRKRAPLGELPHPSLLPSHRARAILRAAVSARRPLGAFDTDRLLASITRGRPIRVLPRRLRWWARDTDVLVDTGDGMLPFRRDQAAVIDALYRLLGRSRVEVWRFHGQPAALFEGAPEDVLPIDPSRACLVLSDIGAGDRSVLLDPQWPGGWRRLARAASRSSAVLVLTPYGADTVLSDPEHALACVTWDEQTQRSHIRRARRRRPW